MYHRCFSYNYLTLMSVWAAPDLIFIADYAVFYRFNMYTLFEAWNGSIIEIESNQMTQWWERKFDYRWVFNWKMPIVNWMCEETFEQCHLVTKNEHPISLSGSLKYQVFSWLNAMQRCYHFFAHQSEPDNAFFSAISFPALSAQNICLIWGVFCFV
jgi:hypothetical protein